MIIDSNQYHKCRYPTPTPMYFLLLTSYLQRYDISIFFSHIKGTHIEKTVTIPPHTLNRRINPSTEFTIHNPKPYKKSTHQIKYQKLRILIIYKSCPVLPPNEHIISPDPRPQTSSPAGPPPTFISLFISSHSTQLFSPSLPFPKMKSHVSQIWISSKWISNSRRKTPLFHL